LVDAYSQDFSKLCLGECAFGNLLRLDCFVKVNDVLEKSHLQVSISLTLTTWKLIGLQFVEDASIVFSMILPLVVPQKIGVSSALWLWGPIIVHIIEEVACE
jgi:hypothetical protein